MTFEGEAKNKQKKLRIVRKLMIGRHIYIYIYIYIYVFCHYKTQKVTGGLFKLEMGWGDFWPF